MATARPHLSSPAKPNRRSLGSRRQAVCQPHQLSFRLLSNTQTRQSTNASRLLQPAMLRRSSIRQRHHPRQHHLGPGDPRAPGRRHNPGVGRHQPGQELHGVRGPQRGHVAQDHLAAADWHCEPVVAKAAFSGVMGLRVWERA